MAWKIVESGMEFVGPDEERLLRIEEERNRLKLDFVRPVEFALLRGDQLSFVEAKATVPREDEVDGVAGKFVDSLQLVLSSRFGFFSGLRVSSAFERMDWTRCAFRFILVVRKCELRHLAPFQQKLHRQLRGTEAIWNLGSDTLAVLDENGARCHGFISQILSEKMKWRCRWRIPAGSS